MAGTSRMPVQKIDMLIGVVLALGLVGSVIGTVVYEEVPQSRTFDVTWATSSQDLPEQEESQTGGGETEFTFDVDRANLTEGVVNVVVASSSTRAQPRQITVTVSAPNATDESVTFSLPSSPSVSASVDVPVAFATVPNATEIQALDIDQARADLNTMYATTNGTGPWTVTVEIQGEPVAVGEPTYQITMAATLSYYTGDVTIPTPDIN